MFVAALLTCLIGEPAPARPAFEAIARDLKSFQANAFIYETDEWRMPKAWEASWRKGVAALRRTEWRTDDLVELLRHDDPKVRVLALTALFDRQDPALLPHFAAALKDDARHFPEFSVARSIPLLPGTKDPDPEEIDPRDVHRPTVGDFARWCVRFWLEPAGYRVEDLPTYLADTKRDPFRSSWYSARLRRVTSETGAGPHYYHARKALYQAFREELDALVPARRDWVLIWVASQNPYGPAASEELLGGKAAVVAAGKRLGPDRLRAVLRGETIPGDADLRDDERCLELRRPTVAYILRHAADWLTPADAAELRKTYARTRDIDWVLAAAALQPADAADWLRAAIADHAGPKSATDAAWRRARLAAGLVRLAGPDQLDYVADWYYGEPGPTEQNTYSSSRHVFVGALNAHPGPAGAKALARLIRDRRFPTNTPTVVLNLGIAVNRQTGREVVPAADLRYSYGVSDPNDDRQRLERMRKALMEWAGTVR